MMDVQLFKMTLAKDVLGGIRGTAGGNNALGEGGSTGGAGTIPSGASGVGQVFGGDERMDQQKGLLAPAGLSAGEDEEYGLYDVDNFIQSLRER